MSKWRPSPLNCLYVIPDVHGAFGLLKALTTRITPLRKSDGGKDLLIFLGDYIDRHVDSHKVLDLLINLRAKYGSQVIFLLGNHEMIFLAALNLLPDQKIPEQESQQFWDMWLRVGGKETITGYLQRANIRDYNFINISKERLISIIPESHIKLIQSEMLYVFEHEDYVFLHAGCNPTLPLAVQNPNVFLWDRSLYELMLKKIKTGQSCSWDKTIVTGHNGLTGRPIIHPKYLMLDYGAPRQLLGVELRSMEAFLAQPGKRLVKYTLEETLPEETIFL